MPGGARSPADSGVVFVDPINNTGFGKYLTGHRQMVCHSCLTVHPGFLWVNFSFFRHSLFETGCSSVTQREPQSVQQEISKDKVQKAPPLSHTKT